MFHCVKFTMLFANIGDPSAGRPSLQGHRPTSAETELCRPTEPRVPQPHGGHPAGNSDILSSSCDSLKQKMSKWTNPNSRNAQLQPLSSLSFGCRPTSAHGRVMPKRLAVTDNQMSSSLRPNLCATLQSSVWDWISPDKSIKSKQQQY